MPPQACCAEPVRSAFATNQQHRYIFFFHCSRLEFLYIRVHVYVCLCDSHCLCGACCRKTLTRQRVFLVLHIIFYFNDNLCYGPHYVWVFLLCGTYIYIHTISCGALSALATHTNVYNYECWQGFHCFSTTCCLLLRQEL